MDGSNRRVIIRRNIHWPNGLTIDYSAQKIYWIDAKTFYIAKANYDGSDHQSILRSAPSQCSLGRPYALALYADKLYWTDWKTRGIHLTNKNKGLRCPVILSNTVSPMDIRAYERKRQMPRPGEFNFNVNSYCLAHGGKRRSLGPRNDVLTTCKAVTLRDGQRIIAAFFPQ